jgi:hypothetical protein
MPEESVAGTGADRKEFMKKHRNVIIVFLVAAILTFIAAIYVFLWFVRDAQTTGLVPSILGLWTLGNLVTFILRAIFWELVIVGVPVVIGAAAAWQWWWRRLPNQEWRGFRFFGKRSRRTRGGSGVSFYFFIAFCIKVSLDGNWNVPIAAWPVDYVVSSMLAILVWSLIIFGIPIAIGVIWWVRHTMKSP